MAKIGRPTKLTPEIVRKLEEAFAMDCTVVEACLNADISRQTYYQFLKANQEYRDRFEVLRNKPFLKARRTIIDSLDEPDYAFKYMEKKKKDEFSSRVETVNENTNLNIDLSDEERKAIEALEDESSSKEKES